MKLYRNVTGLDGKRGWIETKPEVVSNIVDNYIWADIWEKKYYLNYEELYANGHTTPKQIPESELDEIATGKASSLPGKRLLTVGTDKGISKLSTALELYRAAQQQEIESLFLATGPAGLAIAGDGVPLDAVRV